MRKRYVQVLTENGYELIEAERYQPPPRNEAPMVWGDLKPYQPVAGKEGEAWLRGDGNRRYIEGRRQHREYLRRNGLVEVGNEKKAFMKFSGKTEENFYRFNRYREAPGGWEQPDRGRLKR